MKKAIVIIVWVLMQSVACYGQGWFELGTGSQALNALGGITTICSDTDGRIYAAGGFTDSDWAFGKYYVAKWDNILHNWSELGGKGVSALNANDLINSICVDKFGAVFAAGDFTDSMYGAYTEGYEYVAKWDPTTGGWSKLGEGANALNALGTINSICVDDSGNVYCAGNFRNSLGQSYVAKWNGTNWTELYGLNANSFIYSICVNSNMDVFAAGYFSNAAGFCYVAKWSNSAGTWSELGSGFDTTMADVEITSIRVDSASNVYAALNVTDTPSSITLGNVFKWDGTIWNKLGNLNANNDIYTICLGDSGFVYASGQFINASNKHYVAEWNPQTNIWSELGGVNSLKANSGIAAICTDKFNHVFAAGDFTDSISRSNNFQYVAEYGINTLEVPSLNRENAIISYPNPATTTLNFEFPQSANATIRMMDITGRVLSEQQLEHTGKATFDISSFKPGLYLYQIVTENILQTGKIIME